MIACGLITIHDGHGDIHQDQIWLELFSICHSLGPVFRYDEVVIILQDLGEQVNIKLNVFNDQDGFQAGLRFTFSTYFDFGPVLDWDGKREGGAFT